MKKKANPIDLIIEKNKQIDEIADMMLDDTISEADKHRKLDEYIQSLGLIPNLLNHIEEKRKGPMFPNG